MENNTVCKIELTATRTERGVRVEASARFHGSYVDKVAILSSVLKSLRLSGSEATLACLLACRDDDPADVVEEEVPAE